MIEQFGKVADVQIMTEKGTEKPRGFGFAILDNYDDVDKLCIKKYHRIKVKPERERLQALTVLGVMDFKFWLISWVILRIFAMKGVGVT